MKFFLRLENRLRLNNIFIETSANGNEEIRKSG
jgi:hypothetical protein